MNIESTEPDDIDLTDVPPAQLARVRDYRHGRLSDADAQAFEEELLESPELRDALWLSAAVERGLRSSAAPVTGVAANDPAPLREPAPPTYSRPLFALAAGILLGAVGTLAVVRPGPERLSSGDAVIATLDVARESPSAAPAVHELALPHGTRSLVLELPIGPNAVGAYAVHVQPVAETRGPHLDLADVHAGNGFLTVALPAPAAGDYEVRWAPTAGGSGAAGVRQLRIVHGDPR